MNKNQRIKVAVSMMANVDRVIVRRDAVEVRRSFFYRHGFNEEKFAKRIERAIPSAVVKDSGERWQNWPKDSWWWVVFEVADVKELLAKADVLLTNAEVTWEEEYEAYQARQG